MNRYFIPEPVIVLGGFVLLGFALSFVLVIAECRDTKGRLAQALEREDTRAGILKTCQATLDTTLKLNTEALQFNQQCLDTLRGHQ